MKAGRKPQPQFLKELHNTVDKRYAHREPETPSGPFEPDSFINRTPFGRVIWDQLIASAPLGLLKPIDLELFRRLVIALARAKEADEQVLRVGMMVQVGLRRDANGEITDPGSPQQNPYLAIVNRQTDLARKLSSELGLPISARARVGLADAPLPTEPNPGPPADQPKRRLSLDEFLSKKPH